MRWTDILGLLILIFVPAAHSQTPDVYTSGHIPLLTGKSVSVRANLSGNGFTIPSNFVGYSINTNSMIYGGYLKGSNVSLCNLAKLIGANGVLRVGGLDQDAATPPPLTQQMANDLESFRSCLGSGWTLIYGLDGVANNSATAATQAGYIASASGSNATFQFTNEPIDGSNFTVSSFQTMWNSYRTAVLAAVPGANLAAWDDGNFGYTQTAINGLTGGVSGLKYVTQHWYSGPCGTVQTPSYLISSIETSVQTNTFTQNYAWSASAGVLMRMTETNSICGGGALGSSDRLMASTWYLNQAIALASAGWSGINTHNNFCQVAQTTCPVLDTTNPNTYGALLLSGDGNFYAGAVFNGLYLFSRIEGQQIIPVSISGSSFNIMAIATKGANGNANVIVVNDDVSQPATIFVDQSSAWSTANVLQIKSGSGVGCTDASVTIGGATIGESGSWTGSATSLSNGRSISLGPCESALIQIQP